MSSHAGILAFAALGLAMSDGFRHPCSPPIAPEPKRMVFVVFGDQTNGNTTHAGGRFLEAELVGDGRAVILDFNRAYNPPCAFTDFATCPLPVPDNLLPLRLEAGERSPSSVGREP